MKKTTSLFLFIICSIVSYSQDPSFYKLAEEQFSNTNIFSLLYDNNTDILHAATDRGLYNYSLNKFQKTKFGKNVKGTIFFNLKQNSKGEIFCNKITGKIYKIVDDTWKLFYKPIDKKTGKNANYFFLEQDNYLINNDFAIVKVDNKGNILENIFKKGVIIDSEKQEIQNVNNATEANSRIFFSVVLKNKKTYIVEYVNDKLQVVKETNTSKNARKTLSYYKSFNLNNHIYSLSQFGNISPITNSYFKNFKRKNKERILNLDEKLAIGMSSTNGFRYFSLQNDTLVSTKQYLENTFVSTACMTANKTIILGTFGEGIIVIPNKEIEKTDFKSLLLDIVVSPNNDVTISTRAGEIFSMGSQRKTLSDKVNHNVDRLFYSEKKLKLPKSKVENVYYDNNKRGLFTGIKKMVVINETTILTASSSGVDLYQFSNLNSTLHSLGNREKISNSIKYTISKIVSDVRIIGLEWSEKDSLIYYTTSKGIYSKAWNSADTEQLLYQDKKFFVRDLLFNKDTLILGTSSGLFFYYNNKFVASLTEKDGLKSNIISQIKVKDNLLFILSDKGLQIYDLVNKKFLYVGKRNGIECKQVNNFSLSNDKIWLLEKHSCYSIDIADIRNGNKSDKIFKLYFNSLSVKKIEVDLKNKSSFKYNENPFEFEFDYRNIDTKREVKIHYFLEGLENDWNTIRTDKNKVKYKYLPKGKYTFKIKATFRGQETETLEYKFEVLPPFWQQWWFYLLVLAILTLIISAISYYRIKIIRIENKFKLKQKSVENDIIDAKIKSIKAQMNPHFIYNSINSIQDLILQEDTLNSYDYLVKFSTLVRNIIENSDNDFLVLEKEMEFIKIYLDFEKLRFNKSFVYTINNNLLKENIKIPSSIIQPFLENAIKYRLLHKDGIKEISIDLEKENDFIKCTITDNGIGLRKEKELQLKKEEDYQSFSSEAIDKRLKIFKELQSIEIEYTINDLVQDGKLLGTQVVILLPQTTATNKTKT